MSTSEDELKYVSIALLFGNFDENGRLENDIFDSTEQKHLASLSKLGFESILKEVIGDETIKEEVLSDNEHATTSLRQDNGEHDGEGYFCMTSSQSQDSTNFDIKSLNAKDFFDIDEMAEDELQLNENYDADDESKTDVSLMPPPPILLIKDQKETEITIKMEEYGMKKLETPLAAMLPSKYADVDVRCYYSAEEKVKFLFKKIL